jgi:hypothetical protein
MQQQWFVATYTMCVVVWYFLLAGCLRIKYLLAICFTSSFATICEVIRTLSNVTQNRSAVQERREVYRRISVSVNTAC